MRRQLTDSTTMKTNAHYLAIFGASSQVLVPIGFAVSLLHLQSAASGQEWSQFDDLQHVISSFNTTTNQMASAFDFFLWAFGFAMLALVFFFVAIIRLRYRRQWVFWFSCIYGACLTCLAPLGTPFGLFLLIYALMHRQEFVPSASASSVSPA